MRRLLSLLCLLSIAACSKPGAAPAATAAPVTARAIRGVLPAPPPGTCDVSLPAPLLGLAGRRDSDPVVLPIALPPGRAIPPGYYFSVYRSTANGTFEPLELTRAERYRDRKTAANQTYRYRVTTWSQGCESDPSNVISVNVTTPDIDVGAYIVDPGGSALLLTLFMRNQDPRFDALAVSNSANRTTGSALKNADGTAIYRDSGTRGTVAGISVAGCANQQCGQAPDSFSAPFYTARATNPSYDFNTSTLSWGIEGAEFTSYLVQADCGGGFVSIGITRDVFHRFVDPRIGAAFNCGYRVLPFIESNNGVSVYFQESSTLVPSGAISAGYFFVGNTGYYTNNIAHYCSFQSFADLVATGGPGDANTIRRFRAIPGNMISDGSCLIAGRIPAGFFFIGGTGFYANTAGHYCGFSSYENYLAAGAPHDSSRVARFFAIPSTMISDGVCQVRPRTYSPRGMFLSNGTVYHNNDDGHYCKFLYYAQYVVAGGPRDASALPVIPNVYIDPSENDGNCLGLSVGYTDYQAGGVIYGWALDPNSPSESIQVHVYADAEYRTLVGVVRTDTPRPDVNGDYLTDGNHGFKFVIPPAYRNRGQRLYFYAIGVSATTNPQLTGSPWTVR